MKTIAPILVLLFSVQLYSARIPTLDVLTEQSLSEHFVVWSTPADSDIAHLLTEQGEILWHELEQEFGTSCDLTAILALYPDLQTLHHAINWPDAPDWCIGQVSSQGIWSVSPHHPGPLHSFESVMRGIRVKIVQIFMYAIYGTGHEPFPLPRWLHQGFALYRAQFFDPAKARLELAQQTTPLPTLAQLENAHDTRIFDRLKGFKVSYSLIDFLMDQYGWDTIVAILDDYDTFETAVGIDKEQFMAQWADWLTREDNTAVQQ